MNVVRSRASSWTKGRAISPSGAVENPHLQFWWWRPGPPAWQGPWSGGFGGLKWEARKIAATWERRGVLPSLWGGCGDRPSMLTILSGATRGLATERCAAPPSK